MDKTLLKENRVHGDITFPLDAYHIETPPGSIVLNCHWHEELEFIMVKSGKAIFQIETDYFTVQAGDGIFINAGEMHAGYPLDYHPCSYEAIVFNAALLHSGSFDSILYKYIDPIMKNRLSFKRHFTCSEIWEQELLQSFKKASEHILNRTAAYELSVKSELLAMLALLVTNSTPVAAPDEKTPEYFRLERLKNAIKYIQDNYSHKLSTLDISTYLNMSEGHFCRLFKQYFKRTPIQYLNYYRIARAARLLEETEQKVLEIAMEVGFDNISYFIVTFKHYMGTTPSKFRNHSI
ncbi:MAG: helix-turn-helix domain-containing protein [Clostridia bacterium]|nr:helix-turn-helix domain-containing protein [Clostridia bacterium]